MKNYLENLTIENVDQKISEFIKDFNSEVKNTKVEHIKYGLGTIDSIDDDACSYEVREYETRKIIIDDQEVEKQVLVTKWQKDLTCSILLDTMRRFSLKVAIDSGRLKLLENEKIIKDYLAISEPLLKVLCEKEAKEKAEYEAEQQRIEEEKQAKIKEEKLREKAEKKKRDLLAYTKNIDNNSYIKVCDELYMSLGWLAKHTKKISAVMPDYLEPWFVSVFGNNAERKAVDSKLRTSGGFQYQWSLALTLDVDTTDDMPLFLSQYLSKSDSKIGKKRLSNTEFIYRIAKDYGFEFGKVQNIDEIKKYIPTDKMYDFELGYNA